MRNAITAVIDGPRRHQQAYPRTPSPETPKRIGFMRGAPPESSKGGKEELGKELL